MTSLLEQDPQIAQIIANEIDRQRSNINLIASENYASKAVLEAQGSVLTNKYAEGYPGRRYYGGCEFVDVGERLAIQRAKELFEADHANVQPHSGAQANMAAYFSVLERGRPWVTVKAAITLDGRIADVDGDSQWITGPEARAAGHALRNSHDAVLVGAGTLRADDPSLNTRLDGGRDALPVLLDTDLGCPADAKVLGAGRRPVIYCAQGATSREIPADIVEVPRAETGVALGPVLSDLADRGVHSVLVEGGGKVIRSLLDQGLVDRVELFLGPRILAGGPGWVGGAPFPLAAAPGFTVVATETVGRDAHLTLERA